MSVARTVVCHFGGIGDFLLCCPSIAALAKGTAVELVGNPQRLELARLAKIAQAVHDENNVEFHTLFGEPSMGLREFLESIDQAVIWLADDDGKLESTLGSLGIEHVHVHPGLPPDTWARHASEYYLDCLNLENDMPFRLGLSRSSSRQVILHPGSGGKTKNWSLGSFIECAEQIGKSGFDVVWCVGPAEREDDALMVELGRSGFDLLETTSLVELAGELAGCALYVGNDSGITHLAAASGCPTVAIFGPTESARWAPRGTEVQVVEGNPWPSPKRVLDAAMELLSLPADL